MFFVDNNEIIRRLKKYPVLTHLPESRLRKLVEQCEPLELKANEVLFYATDPSDFVYYVVEGHLDAFSSNTLQHKLLSFHRGEMVGEISAVTGGVRGLVVVANQDSQLLKVDRNVFFDFFRQDPDSLWLLTQTMAKHFRHFVSNFQDVRYPYSSIVVVNLSSKVSIDPLKEICREEAKKDFIHVYDKKNFEDSRREIVPFLYECEDEPGVSIFFAENNEESWNRAVIDQADYIYLIVKEGEWELISDEVRKMLKTRPSDIVIVHDNYGNYQNTNKFYERYLFKRHHHIETKKGDYQRIYRYITGQAIGLAISGGGFRGYAHYGLIKALSEAKIPIDCIGGSSMGAAIGGILSMNFDWTYFDKIFTEAMKKLSDVRLWHHITIPLVSAVSGEVATRVIKETFGKYRIENLPTNYFCVTTNLSKGQKEIQKRGELWEWVRASVSIPGLMPPFTKEGSIYVDGGICSNLPVTDMREHLNCVGKVIAFDIRIPPFMRKEYAFPPVLNFKELLAYRMGRKNYNLPSLIDVLVESFSMGQYMFDAKSAEEADVMVAPDTSSLLHFFSAKGGESLLTFAYDLAKEKMAEKRALFARWIIE